MGCAEGLKRLVVSGFDDLVDLALVRCRFLIIKIVNFRLVCVAKVAFAIHMSSPSPRHIKPPA
jgi:hypothetical protein